MSDKKRDEYVREQLKKTNAIAWKKLISQANSHGEKEAVGLGVLAYLTRQYYEKGGHQNIRYIEFKSENPKDMELRRYHNYVVISEDGSLVPGDAISMHYYVVVSSAIVIFLGYNKLSIESPRIEVDAELLKYPMKEDLSLIKKKASLDMMKRENSAINKALSKFLSLKDTRKIDSETPGVLITDGPLVDPPQPFKEEAYEKFINARTSAIRELLENNVLPVGFIKRVIGNIFSSANKEELKKYTQALGSENSISLADMGDYALATFMFELKRRVLTERENSDFILYTEPLELPENEIKSYKDYKEKGLYIYYSIIKLSGKAYPRGLIYRIEVPFLEKPSKREVEERFENALSLLYLWTPVGLRYPLPISLAHQTCTIKKPVAKLLVKEILTKFVSENVRRLDIPEEGLLKHYLLDRGI